MRSSSLSIGDSGDEVAQLHEELRRHGLELPAGEVRRRFFGPATRQAVRAWQRTNGLDVSGVVDEQNGLLVPAVTPRSPRAAPSPHPAGNGPAAAPAPFDRPAGFDEQRAVGSGEILLLHQALAAIGIDIADDERDAQRLGPTTRQAVSRLQLLIGIEPTGTPDAATLELARATLDRIRGRPGEHGSTTITAPSEEAVVEGTVSDTDGLPLVGVTVLAQQRGLRDAREVGRATTDERGRYRISYGTEAVPDANAAPDLQFLVLATDGGTLYRSPVHCRVARWAEVPLPLGGARREAPPEFSDVGATLRPQLGRLRPEELVESERHRDLTFLAADTGLDRSLLALYSVAARLANRTDLPAELFYGLLRQNVPADAAALVLASTSAGTDLDKNADRLLRSVLTASPAVWKQAVESAIAAGVIVPSYAERADGDLARLQEFATGAALDTSAGMGKTPIAAVLSAAAIPTVKQERFIALYAAVDRPGRAFWRDLAKHPDFSKQEVSTLQFVTSVGRSTRGHLPLLNALLELRQEGTVKGTRDLARYSAADWKTLLQQQRGGAIVGIPANFTAQDPEQAVNAYAYLLERNFERAHPTTAFSARLAEDTVSPLPAKEAVTQFLDTNPTFSLLRTNLDRYLKDTQRGMDGQVRESLLTGQRLLKLTSRYASAKPLLADRIGSAEQIYAMGPAQFVATYRDHPDVGPAQAARIYAVAEQTYALALSTMMNVHMPLVGVNPAAIAPQVAPSGTVTELQPAVVAEQPAVAADLSDFPNLQTLFGSFDMFDCQHCRSVLSPAAYLVDMLHFLGKRTTNGKSAKEVLLGRRPDLTQIELTCPNTNTILPYIDLVNELLEDVVAPPPNPVAAARARQTTLTTDELNANPEHSNDAAYTKLANQVFPWQLPFDLPLHEARTYLGMLGTDRVTLMRAFGEASDLAVAVEGLGLSQVEADIITGTATHSSWEYWGLNETGNTVADPADHTVTYSGGWLDVLSHVRILLDRSGLAYGALAELLNTRFVNPDRTVALQCNPADSGDLGTMTVTGLNAGVLDRLHRFVRMMRRLGWDAYDVDTAVMQLQAGTPAGLGQLNATLLRQVYAVQTAMQRFDLPVPAAVALLARIDTWEVPQLPGDELRRRSLYHELFQSRAVRNPVDVVFALNADGTEIDAVASKPALADHRATLIAAFEVPDAELGLAIEAFTDGALTLANLSALYRNLLLARGLRLSVRELRSVKALVERELGVAPFFAAVDPFDATRPELLRLFCDEVDRIRGTRFSITQLDFLLRHVYEATSGVAPDDVVVGTLLKSIRDKLVKLEAEHPDAADPGGNYVQLGTGLIGQELADTLGLPTAVAAEMVGTWLESRSDSTKPLVVDFLALPGVARSPSRQDAPVARTEAGFEGYFSAYTALAKAAAVVSGLSLTTEETAWLRGHGVDVGLLDPTALPLSAASTPQGRYVRWRRLAGAAAVKAALPSDGTPFTSLLDLARSGADKATYLDALATRASWAADSLRTLMGDPANAGDAGLLGLVYPDDYRSERALAKLVPAFALLRRLGISANVGGWIGGTVSSAQARDITRSVKAKYSTRRWSDVAKPPRDVLRELQREALVAYLLAHPPSGVGRWQDANDVYARYLIDVEMGACQGTSRIVQANATIQLFVQRCMLNLEPEVTVDAAADADWLQWQWISRYRVWEANRKVFLYPENWVQPELRRDKSPFFRELENELLQSDVTKDTAEEAFRGYLEKLDAVARLDVVGLYHEPSNPSVLHVVARKQGNPPTYYYRQWIDSSRWTAWTKIDLDIVSDHVVPIVWNRRPYLFWAVVTRKPNSTQDTPTMQLSNTAPSPAAVHLEVQLAWSELRGGKWQPTQSAPQVMVWPWDSEPSLVTLKTSIADPLLRIDLFHQGRHFGEFVLGGVGNTVEAFVVSTNGLDKVGPETRALGTLAGVLAKGSLLTPTNSASEGMAIVPVAQQVLDATRQRVSACHTTYAYYNDLSSEVVLNQADRYRLLVPHQSLRFDSSLPFFYQDAQRCYFVVPTIYYQNGNYFTTTAPAYVYHPFYKARYAFSPFYHAFVPLLVRELNRGGVDALFQRQLQLDPAAVQGLAKFDFGAYYKPTVNVLGPEPVEGIDFAPEAGYALYNWELFFHAPFQIGEALSRNQRFEEAKHWYEYVFNPTSVTDDSVPQRYWVTKPFYNMTTADYRAQAIQRLMKLVKTRDPAAEHQVAQWRANPFDPHIIAGLRPVAYQRAIVMKYIDNLIAWGDHLFRQDTMESVNEATQLYVLAAELLGPRPELVPRADPGPASTYADIEAMLDDFSNAVAAAENALPPVVVNVPVDANTPKLPVLPTPYFGIPPNEQLLRYWDTVADRLFKVRHCMNIEGVVRQLALFAPPIDPGLLIRATAAGLDLGSVLSDTAGALPPYRFRVVLREALELAETVRGLGAELLSCLQLRDADRLDLMRSGAERTVQDRIRAIQQRMADEADQQIEVIGATRLVVREREKYFDGLAQGLMNTWEAVSMGLTAGSAVSQAAAAILEATSGSAAIVVDVQFGASGAGGSPHATVKFGGENVSNAAAGWARAAKIVAAALQTGAQMSALTGQYQRRKDEWVFQRDVATKELAQIDAQALAASIRKDIVEKTRDNHEIVATTAAAVDEFLHSKFTNRELYEWMVAQTSATYFQAYQLAFTVAKRAELCFRRELGLRDSSYVRFGYWDSLKKGLLAADKLLYDLRRMEAAYYAQHVRERELTKHVSLLNLDPFALVKLRSTGECTVRVPELLFDLDNPGHYQRTLKTVGVTVPCVVGPYTGVSLTLTLLDNQIRESTDTSPQYARQPGDDARFVDDPGGFQAIVTSGAQNDPGLFERRLDDERYLPFEGAGAISTWKLRLNAVYPQFDHRTISDVVLHLHYTARDAGATLAGPAAAAVKSKLNEVALAESRAGLYRLISVRQEYATAWYKFLDPGGAQEQVLTIDSPPDGFAFFTHGFDLKVTDIDVLAKLADAGDYTLVMTRPGAPAETVTMSVDGMFGGLHHYAPQQPLAPKSPLGRAPAAKPYPRWTFKLQKAGAGDFRSLAADEIDDLVLIVRYEVVP